MKSSIDNRSDKSNQIWQTTTEPNFHKKGGRFLTAEKVLVITVAQVLSRMNDLIWKFKDGKGLKDTEARVRWERCIIILNGLVAS